MHFSQLHCLHSHFPFMYHVAGALKSLSLPTWESQGIVSHVLCKSRERSLVPLNLES